MKDELLEKICDVFSIPYKRNERGIVVEIDSAIWFYEGFQSVLKPQIENKEKLIALLESRIKDTNTAEENLRKNEELYSLKNELYHLHVKYISNNDYIKNYQFHQNQHRATKGK